MPAVTPHGARDRQDPFAPFRPRRGRAVALGLAVVALVIFGALAVVLPGPDRQGPWRLGDRIMVVGVGLVMAAAFWRYASIRAVPSREGLVVQNLVVKRTLAWPEIVGVNFVEGMPWPQLDLADTDTMAIMAIQRADGAETAQREASRLAGLVEALGEADAGPSGGQRNPGDNGNPSDIGDIGD